MGVRSGSPDKTPLHVLGVHLDAEGYPNVRYRIRGLRAAPWVEMTETRVPMLSGKFLLGRSRRRLVPAFFRSVYAHLVVVVKYLARGRPSLVYVPYPAVFTGLILSWLPRTARPDRIVLDAFISLYDTAVNDRKLLSPASRVSVLLWRLEKMAYSRADLVIADTHQSASYLRDEFHLPENKVVDIPLATNEEHFRPQPYQPDQSVCRVLFVGTMIPLHGVSAIMAAAARLQDCGSIRFRIVGAGQDSPEVEEMVSGAGVNLEWISAWQRPEVLAEMISEADICLGIFGAGEKMQRVCPLKIYAYAACGRPIITGDTEWARYARKNLPYQPYETVAVNDGVALADRIRQVAGSPECRQRLAANSRRFYEEKLSNEIGLSRLEALLRDAC